MTQDFPPESGGIAVFLYNLCDQISCHGHQVDILTPARDGSFEADARQPYHVYRYVLKRKLSSTGTIGHTLALHRRRHYDVVLIGHFMTTHGLGALFLSKLFRVPYVILIHGYDLLNSFQMSRVDNIVARVVLNNASWVFANSNYTKGRVIAMGYDSTRVTVVNPGVDVDEFRPGIDASAIRMRYGLDGKKVILTVSRLDERKGYADVLRALPRVIEQVPNTKYLIAGTGPEMTKLKAMAHTLGLSPNIFFLGFVSDSDLPALYSSCDVFIMPSFVVGSSYEGFGIVFVEASACGKPVVGSRSGGIPDAVMDGVTGLLVEPGDVQGIARALVKLLTDAKYAHTLGVNGRLRAEREFSWQSVGDKLNTVLCNLDSNVAPQRWFMND